MVNRVRKTYSVISLNIRLLICGTDEVVENIHLVALCKCYLEHTLEQTIQQKKH